MYWPGGLKSAPGQCLCRGLDYNHNSYSGVAQLQLCDGIENSRGKRAKITPAEKADRHMHREG